MQNIIISIFILVFLSACSSKPEPKPEKKEEKAKIITNTAFDYIDGFHDDDLDLAFEVFKKACEKSSRKTMFKNVCAHSVYYEDGRNFFVNNFEPKQLKTASEDEGLITGYYEPLLYGSRTKSEFYKYPVYKTPYDLKTLNKRRYPHFKQYKYKAKRVNGRYVPYDKREQIEKRADLKPLLYVNDRIDLFFLQIQGSGRVQLDNGEMVNLAYANQNGRSYFPIGRKLLNDGHLSKDNVSMQAIRAFLETNPHMIDEVFNSNASYVFFRESKNTATGSLNVPLVAKRNIAVDRKHIPLGMPVFLQTKNPITKEAMNKLVVAADTGGAIKGKIRVDYFFGYGSEASILAGHMKEKGKVYILVPKI